MSSIGQGWEHIYERVGLHCIYVCIFTVFEVFEFSQEKKWNSWFRAVLWSVALALDVLILFFLWKPVQRALSFSSLWLHCATGSTAPLVLYLIWFGFCFLSIFNVKCESLAVDLRCCCKVRGLIEQLYSPWHYKVNSVALTEFYFQVQS